MPSQSSPMIALLPWGDLIEDFLDGIGVSIDDFSSRMTGGWLFGYVEALRRQGIRSIIFCFSDRVTQTVHKVHHATGAQIVLLRSPTAYRGVRSKMKDPYGWTVEDMYGPSRGLSRQWHRLMHQVAPYLATPVTILAREIHQAQCSAILCQEYEAPRFDASALIGMLLRIPVFSTYQGGNYQRTAIEKHLRPWSLRRCTGLIIGSFVGERVQERYGIPLEKMSAIFNPLDLSEWRPGSRQEARNKLGVSEATRVVVWHGRVDIRTKGLDILLEAWKTVCTLRPQRNILLMLVGTGSDAKSLAEEIERTAVPHVRWINEYILDRADMRQYLNAADVYVFPSRREGFPVAPLEAMACGLPVVAASAPGVVDIFDEGEECGGIVVPVGDAASLASSVGRLLDDDETACRLGVRARARVEQAFSLNNVGIQLRKLLLAN